MAIKSAIIAKIQQYLTGNSNLLTPTDHEKYLHSDPAGMMGEIYGDVITEDQTTENVFDATNLITIFYNFKIVKQGRKVRVKGTVKPAIQGASIQSDIANPVAIATITNTEFQINEEYIIRAYSRLTGSGFRLLLSSDILKLQETIPANDIIEVDFEFFTKD